MAQKPSPEMQFDQIDAALYQKLLNQAHVAGAQFDGDKAIFRGCDFDWNYDTVTCILHVTCTKMPFWLSDKLIKNEFDKMIEQARTGL